MTDELHITDVPAESRYEARVGEALAGWVDYRRIGRGARRRIVAIHTEVPPAFGGRGIGSRLVRHVLADARRNGELVSPMCPLFVAHFERHPEDAGLLAPGRIPNASR